MNTDSVFAESKDSHLYTMPTGRYKGLKPFKKGESGNPGGRKRLTSEEKVALGVVGKAMTEIEMITAARNAVPAALATWVRNLECGDGKAENQAAAYILAYAYGRPKETVKLEGGLVTKDRILMLLTGLTHEQRHILAKRVHTQLLDVRRSASASGEPSTPAGLGSLPIGGVDPGGVFVEAPPDAPVPIMGPDDTGSQQIGEEYVRGAGVDLDADRVPPVQDEPASPASDGEGDLPDPPN